MNVGPEDGHVGFDFISESMSDACLIMIAALRFDGCVGLKYGEKLNKFVGYRKSKTSLDAQESRGSLAEKIVQAYTPCRFSILNLIFGS
jgi:hypothetical protein